MTEYNGAPASVGVSSQRAMALRDADGPAGRNARQAADEDASNGMQDAYGNCVTIGMSRRYPAVYEPVLCGV